MSPGLGLIMQHGYIVENIEKAAAEWVERVGAGPFYLIDQLSLDCSFRGRRSEIALRVAFGYWGSMQIELVQPINDADSVYKEALLSAPGKLNHCATVVSDIEVLLARYGLKDRVIQSGQAATGLKFVYLEEYLPGGLHLELIEPPPNTLQAFSGMEAVAKRWDGTNPMRPMSVLGEDLAKLTSG